MIHAEDNGIIHMKGDTKQLLVQSHRVLEHIFKGSKATDKGRFILLTPVITGLDRLEKVQSDPVLSEHVDQMLDEVWKGMELLEKYIDTYNTEDHHE